METKWFQIDEDNIDEDALEQATQLLMQGEVVAFPTETVYGLGADATSELAVKKIFDAKGRPSDNPLIVHVPNEARLLELVDSYPKYLKKMISAFSPGPITYILPSVDHVCRTVTAGLKTVGLRIPENKIALHLLEKCHVPIAAPSANTSGKPSPTTAQHVLEDLDGKIAAIVDGGATDVGIESTVVDCTGTVPIVLRMGKITVEQIREIVGACELSDQLIKADRPKSPGLKYKHYAPEVPLILVGKTTKIEEVIKREQAQGKRVGVILTHHRLEGITATKQVVLGTNAKDITANLYNALRSLKGTEVDVIISETPVSDDELVAVVDRLQRAATEII